MEESEARIALRAERFRNDEDLEFRINSSVEILYILRDIARHNEPVALFYNGDEDLILTRVLEIDDDEEGLWVARSDSDEINIRLLNSDAVTFVSMHQHIKIQFPISDIGIYTHKNGKAFFVDMPAYMLRLLRWEFVRIAVPPDTPVICIIPTKPKSSDLPMYMHEVPVAEISGDGIGLICEESEDTLLPGSIFRNCQIQIPNSETIKATIRVLTNKTFTAPDGMTRKHVGCKLVFLDKRMSVLLQRFVIHLQGAHELEPLIPRPQTEEQEPEQEPDSDSWP